MKDARTIVVRLNLLQGYAGVLDRRSIRMERAPLGTQDDDRLRNSISHTAKLFFVLKELGLSALEVGLLRCKLPAQLC